VTTKAITDVKSSLGKEEIASSKNEKHAVANAIDTKWREDGSAAD
jgi:hypothetical protein